MRDGRHLLERSVRGRKHSSASSRRPAPATSGPARGSTGRSRRGSRRAQEAQAPCVHARRPRRGRRVSCRRQAAQGLRGVRLRAGLDGERERRRQMLDRLLGMPEQELQAAEVQHQATSVPLVVQLLVDRPRLLCVLAGEHPCPIFSATRTPGSTFPTTRGSSIAWARLDQLARHPPPRPRSRPGGVGDEGATRGSARAGAHGSPDRSASASASSKRPIAVGMEIR